MAEDRKKMLEALVAKRKAEAEGGGRPAHKSKPSSLLSKPASVKKSSPLLHNPKPSPPKPSPLLKLQKQQHHKKDSPPKKKKRVEKYDSEDDDNDDEESAEDSDSEDEPVKKKVPSSKGGSAVKAPSLKPTSLKSKPDAKGKVVVKEKDSGKGKRKSEDSSDDDNEDGGSGEEDVEADSGDEGLDRSNILPGRTRGRNSQPMHYDFTNMSGDDDDDSD